MLSYHDSQVLDIHVPRAVSISDNSLMLESSIFSKKNFLTLSILLEKETCIGCFLSPVKEKYNIFFNKLIYYLKLDFSKKILKEEI